MLRSIIAVFLVISLNQLSAQEKRRLVWEGGASFNYQLFKNWRMNTSIFQRTSFLEENEIKKTELSFFEVNQFFTRGINYASKVSLGYKFRSESPVDDLSIYEHRLTQQFAYTHFSRKTRVVSRAMAEQRIKTESFAHRYRYRISVDMPLSGERIDDKELYFVASNEILFEAINVEENSWENRISTSLGFKISMKTKIELSTIYRLENLTRSIESVLFLNSRAIIRIN